MARIYSSRQMIDPSMYAQMNAAIQQRYANDAARRQAVLTPMRDLLNAAGKTFDDYVARQARTQQVAGENEYSNDPVYQAAREEYIRTGSTGPLHSYVMQREAAKAKQEEAARRAADAEKEKAWHNAVRLSQARPEYGKTLQSMNAAIDAGDYETADIYKNQLKAFETEFGSDAFGNTAESMADARKKTVEANAAKKAEAERLERMGQNIDKEFADNSYSQRIWFETNVIPNLKNVQDKADAKEQVERLAATLTDEDRKALHAKIDASETIGEKTRKATEGAVAAKAGEATGQAITEGKEMRALADKAKEKKAKGFNLTSKEQEAYDKIYGGK